ncbi:peroxisomal carnitine O-octanoyltransferase [Bactrocera oleae]|uniref:peroxisomal carnitine O-octanoyltransferase n=1 Tax=Bactrocera oleae TaxID=104688 RepID=UPI001747F811|nr:peroxisomal carnitine O-octanoyltransferase [Bactrocera oleae]XP_036217103.1 peroxisomal carnitine O-octanoyltransferase [Bactrocera oleae]XP_036217104.1 peroxisomal carnitine O-octanoyltransferase [Bactrocera oleae]XP_036217106.1 peroxisomal carnitine O-octanoyltransferase [Bactrocera oleae]XP_036217107.1 peroxisomal carnitine O-octanoyltransferase [Bactrocera oleae]
MDRASIFFLDEGESNTFDFDETLPPLPLPDLHDTLQRYYDTIKPFGSPSELDKSKRIIADFESGIGTQLHRKLKERAAIKKNWLDEWWDKYAYHTLRAPLLPYIVMAMPVNLEIINIPETPAFLLKNLARIMYHTLEFWNLARNAIIKPHSSNGGKIKYSSALYKRFFSTTRAPGVEYDYLKKYFKSVDEGTTPSHVVVSGKGRMFAFDGLHADGRIISPQEILILLQRVRGILEYEPMGDCVPVLTHDDRTTWANNYMHLQEISEKNKETIETIESSSIVVVFDENEPHSYEETSQLCVNGDFHSKWADRSSTIIAFKNGRFAYVGEHSAYDGTFSVSYALFVQLSIFEIAEPDWSCTDKSTYVTLTELKFDLDDELQKEIERAKLDCDQRRNDIIVTYDYFNEYGKEDIKRWNLHPGSFVQVIMQLAYAELHQEIAATYETALTRHFYNGRTETLRSCTTEVHKFILIAREAKSSSGEIAAAFRSAVNHHNHMMNEARKGNGVDRHLFGLWCTAYENGIDVPEIYNDPLYMKSGGGGNFVLSTSTLGYTSIVGFVAPMTLDGYGVFYSITTDTIYIQITAFRASSKTSAHKFNETFKQQFSRIKKYLEDSNESKL